MDILRHMQTHGYEQIVACHEPSVGLKAFITIHDTTLGPALGGLRMWPYGSEDEALMDSLRLARSLTYKCSIAGTAFGGGNGLIIGDPDRDKSEALIRAFARFVDTLGGRFIISEDVGTDVRDLGYIAQETEHVAGLPLALGGSGDPSVITGRGVYMAMKACAKAVWGCDSLEGRSVAIQGFGKVGIHTAEPLIEEGARLTVADIHEGPLARAREMGATIVPPKQIYDVECDILSPCALGGILNGDTIPRLKARIVAGGANNQLLAPSDGDELHRRGILYAPDYLASAGGVVALHHELYGDYQPELIPELAQRIYDATERVVDLSRSEDIPAHLAGDRLAERRLKPVRQLKPIYR